MKKQLIVFLIGLFLAISLCYPSIYINDEYISANQLNHLVSGKNLLYGFEPYGGVEYGNRLLNVLPYTLALPTISYPLYLGLSFFQDSFRLFIILLAFLSLLAALTMIEFWFPKYSCWRGIPWTYGVAVLVVLSLVVNLYFYREYPFNQYGEIAVLIFTNNILFALLLVFIFNIFKEIFESDWWGIFGIASLLASSSYLFWAGNAKDHILTVLFLAIAMYFFILFIKKENRLYLISSFIAVGWLTWTRPELGLGVIIGMVLSTLLVSYHNGVRFTLISLGCSLSALIGALPLIINNYGLTGNPIKLPFMMTYSPATYTGSVVSGLGKGTESLIISFQLIFQNIILWIWGIFIKPVSVISSGFFQVSPLSVFGIVLILIILFYFLRKTPLSFLSKKEEYIIIFAVILVFSVLLPYFPTFPYLYKNLGIIPDMRYLAPAYIPFLILAFFSLKCIRFNEKCIRMTLKSLVLLVIIELPILFLLFQIYWGQSLADQLIANMFVTYLILLLSLLIFLLVFLQKIALQNLTFPLAALMVSVLSWYLIVGFRFRIIGHEGYNFWFPLIEKLWIIQSNLFPYLTLVKFL